MVGVTESVNVRVRVMRMGSGLELGLKSWLE